MVSKEQPAVQLTLPGTVGWISQRVAPDLKKLSNNVWDFATFAHHCHVEEGMPGEQCVRTWNAELKQDWFAIVGQKLNPVRAEQIISNPLIKFRAVVEIVIEAVNKTRTRQR
ncbi:hypothetical protein CKO28_18525 [Rhodovibrio sodomensis]|uniref:Uncharacterized protein n=1 Tax=Rhodovibrio sodomensis TaxID=1088 RepID=A0ABS1DIC4_9PROT|nr:hypothetical protein [Rhodovibrio sodomensis]